MNTYQRFATVLTQLLGNDTAVRFTISSYMPLSIEDIGPSNDGPRLIALSHTGMQNGDLMRDPELVFEIVAGSDSRMAEPISFRNDYLGLMEEVYRYDQAGRKTHVNARLKAELKDFAALWFRNLKDHGFLSPSAARERLG
jgi:hypothetical protein